MANPFIKLVLMFLSCPYLLLHEKIYAKYILDYFFNVYEYLACIYVCVPHEYLVPIEDKRGCWILQGWSYRRFWKLNPLCWRATSAVNHWVTSPPLYSFLALFPLGLVGVQSDFPESTFSSTMLNDHVIYNSPCAHSWHFLHEMAAKSSTSLCKSQEVSFSKNITQHLVITFPE